MVHLLAVAVDRTGTFGQKEIQLTVGDIPEDGADDWKNAVHEVIFNEGDHLLDDERREFRRLDTDLKINEDGRLVLHGVIPGESMNRELLWKASMHRDDVHAHFATLDKGQLKVYRGTPDHPETTVFETPAVSGQGPYHLGITVSRKLVIYRETEGGKKEIIWKSN